MIHAVLAPISEHQLLELRQMLNSSAGELLRTILQSQISYRQLLLGRATIEGKHHDNQEAEYAEQQVLGEALKYLNALEVFEDFRSSDVNLTIVTIDKNLTT